MRAFTVAAVQIAPSPAPLSPATVDGQLRQGRRVAAPLRRRDRRRARGPARDGVHRLRPGTCPEELWDVVSEVPGPVTEPIQEAARELGVHVVWGTYERGARRGVVHNSAVLIGPDGDVLGVYRKTHPFAGERCDQGGWVTAGRRGAASVDTELGRIGMIICFDGDYPELSRITAVRGAEVICRPSALLRSADLWELTNRARAYDNHVYVVGANATGIDPAGTIYFGNSMVVTPIAEVDRPGRHRTRAGRPPGSTRDGALASLTPGSNVAQAFDHLADRNLDLIRRYARRPAGPGEDVASRTDPGSRTVSCRPCPRPPTPAAAHARQRTAAAGPA